MTNGTLQNIIEEALIVCRPKRLEELEKIRVPHTVKHLPARYLDEKEYQMISGYVKELNIPAEWSGKSVVLVMEGAAHQAGAVLQWAECRYS